MRELMKIIETNRGQITVKLYVHNNEDCHIVLAQLLLTQKFLLDQYERINLAVKTEVE